MLNTFNASRDCRLLDGAATYLGFLRAAGVDLAAPEPVERMFAIFSEYVDRLEHLLSITK